MEPMGDSERTKRVERLIWALQRLPNQTGAIYTDDQGHGYTAPDLVREIEGQTALGKEVLSMVGIILPAMAENPSGPWA